MYEGLCYICERALADMDERKRVNLLVAHQRCYLRAQKFVDIRNVLSRERIEMYSKELGRIYEKRTAGDYTFMGILGSLLLDISDPPTKK